MKKYWEQSISFDEYLSIAQQRIVAPENEHDREYKPYYELGIQRMERTTKKFAATEEQLSILSNKNFKGSILIISEAWCGDASSTVPAVVKFFEGKNPVKIFLKDADKSLISQYLTNGTESIPKILILNENFEVINVWGPRTVFGNSLLAKYKQNLASYTKDDFYNELQVYYAKNRGKDVIDELLELI